MKIRLSWTLLSIVSLLIMNSCGKESEEQKEIVNIKYVNWEELVKDKLPEIDKELYASSKKGVGNSFTRKSKARTQEINPNIERYKTATASDAGYVYKLLADDGFYSLQRILSVTKRYENLIKWYDNNGNLSNYKDDKGVGLSSYYNGKIDIKIDDKVGKLDIHTLYNESLPKTINYIRRARIKIEHKIPYVLNYYYAAVGDKEIVVLIDGKNTGDENIGDGEILYLEKHSDGTIVISGNSYIKEPQATTFEYIYCTIDNKSNFKYILNRKIHGSEKEYYFLKGNKKAESPIFVGRYMKNNYKGPLLDEFIIAKIENGYLAETPIYSEYSDKNGLNMFKGKTIERDLKGRINKIQYEWDFKPEIKGTAINGVYGRLEDVINVPDIKIKTTIRSSEVLVERQFLSLDEANEIYNRYILGDGR